MQHLDWKDSVCDANGSQFYLQDILFSMAGAREPVTLPSDMTGVQLPSSLIIGLLTEAAGNLSPRTHGGP